MKYDDLIHTARRQDAGPTPGPDFPALMGASVAANAGLGKPALNWILGLFGGAAVVTGVVMATTSSSPDAPEVRGPDVVIAAPAGLESEPAPEPEPPVESEPPVGPQTEPERAPPEGEGHADPPKHAKARPVAEDPEALYRSSERHMKAGRLRDARRDLRRIVRKFPAWSRHSTALIDLARLESRMGREQSAACSYRDFVVEYPRDMMAGEAKKALAKLEADAAIDLGACK